MANLSFISKLTANAAIQRLPEHYTSNDVLVKYQSAYKQFHSCKTALAKLTNNILWTIWKMK